MKSSKKISGGARLMASGKHPVLLGIEKADHAIIATAAKCDGRPVSQFFCYHALVAAKRILEKAKNLS